MPKCKECGTKLVEKKQGYLWTYKADHTNPNNDKKRQKTVSIRSKFSPAKHLNQTCACGRKNALFEKWKQKDLPTTLVCPDERKHSLASPSVPT